jgi:hypothetical protein
MVSNFYFSQLNNPNKGPMTYLFKAGRTQLKTCYSCYLKNWPLLKRLANFLKYA